MEIWKPIKGYEGIYEVSNLGRVKSLARKIRITNGFRYTNDVILRHKVSKSGYKQVSLSRNGFAKSDYVHRIVTKAFLGEIPKDMSVNHIDCNKLNNKVDNLEIVTYSENMKHAYKNGLNTPPVKRLFNREQIINIRKSSKEGVSDLRLSIMYECTKSIINRIINKQTYKDI